MQTIINSIIYNRANMYNIQGSQRKDVCFSKKINISNLLSENRRWVIENIDVCKKHKFVWAWILTRIPEEGNLVFSLSKPANSRLILWKNITIPKRSIDAEKFYWSLRKKKDNRTKDLNS